MKRASVQFLIAILAVAFHPFPSAPDALAQSPAGKAELSGLASVSGTVTSAVPFQAAKVYFRNADRRMQYMVYTRLAAVRSAGGLRGQRVVRR